MVVRMKGTSITKNFLLKRAFPILLLACTALLTHFAPAWAVPPLPSSFYGSVQINGADLQPGDTISAWINGVKYAETSPAWDDGDTVYSLDVPGDDSDTPVVIEGGVPGDTVTFRVNGYLATQSAPWASGTNLELPLSVTTRTLDFLAGWNLVTLPLSPANAYNAETLLQAINTQGATCVESAQWLNSAWNTHSLGLPFGQFTIELGQGYFIRCTQPGSWTFEGLSLESGITLELLAGWNLVGIPYPASGYTAASLQQAIQAQGGACSEITRWHNSNWESYIAPLPINNFDILPDEGYFIKCSAPASFTPTP